MESKHSLLKSFQFAFEGILLEFKKGTNFRIQVLLGLASSILAYYLKFTSTEWAILALTISMVIILELLNTAIEEIVNMVSPEIRREAKIAKDVSAGAVLIASIFAILIGIILFIPKL